MENGDHRRTQDRNREQGTGTKGLTEEPKNSKDPDSWETTKEVETFIKRMQNFEIEYTDQASRVTYPAMESEVLYPRGRFARKPKTAFPNRLSFAFSQYRKSREAGYPNKVILDKLHDCLIYIHQAYTANLVKPGPALYSKVDDLTGQVQRLEQDVADLTKKLEECETKRRWGITGLPTSAEEGETTAG
jgi:hypothetical protein